MKNFIILVMLCLGIMACSRITTQPDTHTTTSGTLGSVKANTSLPNDQVDTTLRQGDTIKIVRDSVP